MQLPTAIVVEAHQPRRGRARFMFLRLRLKDILPLMLFIGVAALFQALQGAYTAELCAYPDEPAHAVTGVAVLQYLTHGIPRSPVPFLLDYYRRLPKVAVGHWPPLLYLVEAGAMLAGSPSPATLLALQAALAGILAWMVFLELRRAVGPGPAFFAGAVFLFNPELRRLTSMTMAEILEDLTMFLACLSFARFGAKRRLSDAGWFALWTSAAILTKGTGWGLLLIPPFVLLASRDWGLPWERGIWISYAAIGGICLPWQLYTLRLASFGWYAPPGLAYSRMAAPLNAWALLTLAGIPITICAAAGCWRLFSNADQEAVYYWASLAGLVFSSWMLNTVTPVGVERRHLTAAPPAIFVLAGGGARRLASLAPALRKPSGAAIVLIAAALGAAAGSFPIRSKPHYGFLPVAEALDRLLPRNSAALIISDVVGEGAIISQFAFLQPTPSVFLIRGGKFLAAQGWDGRNYRRRMGSVDDLARELDAIPISVLVVDPSRPMYRADYVDQVEQLLRERSGQWTLAGEYSTLEERPQKVRIYKRAAGMTPIKALPVWIDPPLR